MAELKEITSGVRSQLAQLGYENGTWNMRFSAEAYALVLQALRDLEQLPVVELRALTNIYELPSMKTRAVPASIVTDLELGIELF